MMGEPFFDCQIGFVGCRALCLKSIMGVRDFEENMHRREEVKTAPKKLKEKLKQKKIVGTSRAREIKGELERPEWRSCFSPKPCLLQPPAGGSCGSPELSGGKEGSAPGCMWKSVIQLL